MVRALAPFNRAYRHGLMEGFQLHRLWCVTRLWPGVAHRPDERAPIPWERVIGCFVWTPGRRRHHRTALPDGCVLFIRSWTAEAYWSGILPESRDGTLRLPRTYRTIRLRLEWV